MHNSIKRALALALLALVATSGAFAVNLTLGASGALYMSSEKFDSSSGEDIWDEFEKGDGIYYGVNAELLFDKWALGLYTYFSFYEYDWYSGGAWGTNEMADVDVSLGFSYHLLGTTFILDPFVEAGFGQISKNLTSSSYGGDTEYEDDDWLMIQGTNYWYAGFGLGLNLGELGGFVKVQYHADVGEPEIEKETEWGEITYSPEPFDLDDLKVILGLKIIL